MHRRQLRHGAHGDQHRLRDGAGRSDLRRALHRLVTASIGGSVATKRLLKAAGWDAVFSALAAGSIVSIGISRMLQKQDDKKH